MAGAVTATLVAVLGVIGVVIVQGLVVNQTTTSWDTTVTTLFPYIGLALIAGVVISILVKAFGGKR